MKIEYKEGDIITYPVPGVCVGQCNENTVDKEACIIKIYDNIISNNGLIVDIEIIDGTVKGIVSGKLLYNKDYGIRR